MFVEQVNPGAIERGLVKVLCEVLEERLAEIVCVYGSQQAPVVEIHGQGIWLYNKVFRRRVSKTLAFDDIHAAIDGIVKIDFLELCALLEAKGL